MATSNSTGFLTSTFGFSTGGLSWVLGTYRGWGQIQVFHLVVVLSVLSATVFWYSIALTRRLNSNNALRASIPRIENAFQNIGLSRHMQSVIAAEAVRRKEIISSIHPDDDSLGDLGWLKWNSRGDPGFHISTEIASSFLIIDRNVAKKRPAIRVQNYRSIREYMSVLGKEFPLLGSNQELCTTYVNIYEQARFGSISLTTIDWNRFKVILGTIQDIVEKS